ncbi:hypothetical protein U6G28_02105 [Actinomycetaceae bacterium MB13-C1-2]|nr:hypothetical protein U6G28_02105 [Actinomycetaceae bacterium MB13-C1-2]
METTDYKDAYEGSHYTICGAGGDLDEWVAGYNKMLADQGIGTSTCWSQTAGENINHYAATHGEVTDPFQGDLTVLTLPLHGPYASKLAMFMLTMEDRYFDDVIDNIVNPGSPAEDREE